MMIPGYIISLFTFPGVIVHEMAHQLFCKLCGLTVFEVCYFRIDTPAGYIVHETPKSTYQRLLIGLGPMLINTITGILIAIPVMYSYTSLGSLGIQDIVLLWLAASIAMHSFPSLGDAKEVQKAIIHPEASPMTRFIGRPIVGLLYVFAMGSFFWLDLIYGVLVVTLIPRLVMSFIK